MKLVRTGRRSGENKNENLSSKTLVVHKAEKTGGFTSKKAREQLRNVDRGETHVQREQKYCFSLLNMQIINILVSFVLFSSSLCFLWKNKRVARAARTFTQQHEIFILKI